jgi:hypothetical protein
VIVAGSNTHLYTPVYHPYTPVQMPPQAQQAYESQQHNPPPRRSLQVPHHRHTHS